MVSITPFEALKSYGMSEKEIQIYLACLQLGTATANQISEKTYLNRSTTYDILKSLLEKGIVSKIIINSTNHYEVAEPTKLISDLDEKKKKLLSTLKNFEILKKEVIKKPIVQMYQGKEGFKTILNDILSTKKSVDVISTSKIFDIMKYYFPQYIKMRSELGIKARVIQEESKQTISLKKTEYKENRETRMIPNWTTNTMTFIYGDKVAIIKLIKDEIICILINDNTINSDQRKIFEILWNLAI
jgi:HTH-type transcriptional regulator, sugar sensing transcriptional regulator